MKCIYNCYCCDQGPYGECLAADDSACGCRVTEEQYRRLREEVVDPELCRHCGYRGTPLCSHPGGYYQEQPEGINNLNRNQIR